MCHFMAGLYEITKGQCTFIFQLRFHLMENNFAEKLYGGDEKVNDVGDRRSG